MAFWLHTFMHTHIMCDSPSSRVEGGFGSDLAAVHIGGQLGDDVVLGGELLLDVDAYYKEKGKGKGGVQKMLVVMMVKLVDILCCRTAVGKLGLQRSIDSAGVAASALNLEGLQIQTVVVCVCVCVRESLCENG